MPQTFLPLGTFKKIFDGLMAILEGTENVAEVQGWNACMSSLHLGWQGSRISSSRPALATQPDSYPKKKPKKQQQQKQPQKPNHTKKTERSMVELSFVSPTHSEILFETMQIEPYGQWVKHNASKPDRPQSTFHLVWLPKMTFQQWINRCSKSSKSHIFPNQIIVKVSSLHMMEVITKTCHFPIFQISL